MTPDEVEADARRTIKLADDSIRAFRAVLPYVRGRQRAILTKGLGDAQAARKAALRRLTLLGRGGQS